MLLWAPLDREFAEKIAPALIEAAHQGLVVVLMSGYRSITHQTELYDAWLAGGKKGLPVAPPGFSYHNYGLALDFSPSEFGAIAERAGLRWGARFTPPTNPDPIHVDYGTRYTLAQARASGFPKKLVWINAQGTISTAVPPGSIAQS